MQRYIVTHNSVPQGHSPYLCIAIYDTGTANVRACSKPEWSTPASTPYSREEAHYADIWSFPRISVDSILASPDVIIYTDQTHPELFI